MKSGALGHVERHSSRVVKGDRRVEVSLFSVTDCPPCDARDVESLRELHGWEKHVCLTGIGVVFLLSVMQVAYFLII